MRYLLNMVMTIIFAAIVFAHISPLKAQNTSGSPLQTGDSITLDKYISAVVENHPAVKEAEEALNAAGMRIRLAQSGFLPNLDLSASYSHIGPVSSIDIPVFGSIQLYPENNYSAAVNLKQSIYDFGRTSKEVAFQKESRNMVSISLDEARQKLSMAAITNYFTLVYLQQAVAIKNEQLKTLQEHLDFINKKNETGSSTKYEILTTEVKISAVQSQLTDIEIAVSNQHAVMNSLLGLPENTACAVKPDLNIKEYTVNPDSMVAFALNRRNEMRNASEKITLAELHYKIERTKYYPVISLYASGGGKNGYIPDMNKWTFNYVAGVGLNIPLFDGSRTLNNIKLAGSSITTSRLDKEIQGRAIAGEVIENKNNLAASNRKISQFEMQLKQAEQAYSLAQINYAAGAITNLDLLDASTQVAESRLLLLKARIDGIMNVYKLKYALGDKLY
ncbi:MAG: TolC family protein [Bacteroidota bacterium]